MQACGRVQQEIIKRRSCPDALLCACMYLSECTSPQACPVWCWAEGDEGVEGGEDEAEADDPMWEGRSLLSIWEGK